jgi:hypothetical protein
MKLTGGSCVVAREEIESIEDGRCKPKRKTYFERTPRAHGPDGWLNGVVVGEQGGLARVSWAGSEEKIQANFGF